MRLVLAIAVLYSHCYLALLQNGDLDPLGRATHGVVNLGSMSVDVFFIISGYLITQSWHQSQTIWSFLRKRISRIFPAFVIANLVAAIALPPLVMGTSVIPSPTLLGRTLLRSMLLHPFEYPGMFANSPYPHVINASLWTIIYEFRCYLLIPFFYVLGALTRRWVILCTFIGTVVIAAVLASRTHWPDVPYALDLIVGSPLPWPRLASCFLAGSVFNLYRRHIIDSGRIAVVCAVVLLIALSFRASAAVAIPTCGTYLVLWFAYRSTPLLKIGRHGDFSYGLYIYAFPIQQLVIRLAPGISVAMLFIASMPISLAAGMLSWFIVEKHFLRASHSRQPAIGDAPAVVSAE